MAERELKSMGRAELLELLRQQTGDIAKLTEENQSLRKRTEEKAIALENAGSIAEAALQISNVFKAAQESADVYLENIRDAENRVKGESDALLRDANEKANALLQETERKCADRETREKQYVESLWVDLQNRLIQFYQSYSELGDLVRRINLISPGDINTTGRLP